MTQTVVITVPAPASPAPLRGCTVPAAPAWGSSPAGKYHPGYALDVIRTIEAGGQALAVPADVADHAQVEKAATEIEAQFGPIDVWVNVAFTSVFAPFAEIRPTSSAA